MKYTNVANSTNAILNALQICILECECTNVHNYGSSFQMKEKLTVSPRTKKLCSSPLSCPGRERGEVIPFFEKSMNEFFLLAQFLERLKNKLVFFNEASQRGVQLKKTKEKLRAFLHGLDHLINFGVQMKHYHGNLRMGNKEPSTQQLRYLD